jgi:hypothetical protein
MKTIHARLQTLIFTHGVNTSAATVAGKLRDLRGTRMIFRKRGTHMSRHAWEAAEGKRKADPDAKRAAADLKFRNKYLRYLRKEEKRLLNPPLSTLVEISTAAGNHWDRALQLKNLARLRSIATGKSCLPKKPDKITEGVLVAVDQKTAKKQGAEVIMRGLDATLQSCREPSYGKHQDAYTEWDRKGRPRSCRAIHDNFVRSFALISKEDRSAVSYICHNTQVFLVLPAGYIWEEDTNGLKAVDVSRRLVDYHPGASELLIKDAGLRIIEKLEKNREKRECMAAEAVVEAATCEGVFVCLADSLRAGNCKTGSEAFASRHGIDCRRHYHAPELLAIANGDASRVRLAVTAARLRHRRELERGYADLSEHLVS